jgi:hypothetical protein
MDKENILSQVNARIHSAARKSRIKKTFNTHRHNILST